MAEETEQSEQKKRRLRAAPETVRERTAKLQEQKQSRSEQSPRNRAIRSFFWGFTWPLKQLGRPVAALFRWLGKYRFFRAIGRILFPSYFRNSWREIRLVTWPTFRQTWKLTYAVIIFSIIFGVIIFLVDFGLDKLFKEFVIKS